SGVVQVLLSLQGVLSGRKRSGGQAARSPVQTSATSQSPAAARQVVPLETSTSVGQVSFTPSQLSATSQPPAAARQTAVLLVSAGHVAPAPVQFSARSQ